MTMANFSRLYLLGLLIVFLAFCPIFPIGADSPNAKDTCLDYPQKSRPEYLLDELNRLATESIVKNERAWQKPSSEAARVVSPFPIQLKSDSPYSTKGCMLEGYWWVLSALIQAVMAFVAFLIAGFTFMSGQTATKREQDPEVAEVLDKIASQDHHRFLVISYSAVVASVLCIGTLVFGPFVPSVVVHCFFWLSTLLALAVFSGGIRDIGQMIDPLRTRRLAKEIGEKKAGSNGVPAKDYFDAFRRLEKEIRRLTAGEVSSIAKEYPLESRFPSQARLVDRLLASNKIDRALHTRLRDIIGIRNAVVHGHVDEVAEDELKKLEAAIKLLREL